MNQNTQYCDVTIIGAGPAGTVCAAILKQNGFNPVIIEKSTFPRLTIGESFLPQNMQFYKEAKLDHIFKKSDARFKNGAEFLNKSKSVFINFDDKSASGDSTTFQVKRDHFDNEIANELISRDIQINFNCEVKDINISNKKVWTQYYCHNNNDSITLESKFIVDSSGFGQVLPKLLKLPITQLINNRFSCFNHIKTSRPLNFDNDKILIAVDEIDDSTWFWIIPISYCRYSVGVISNTNNKFEDLDNSSLLTMLINRNSKLKLLFGNYEYLYETQNRTEYSSKCEVPYGDKFVLIGNSNGFIDPVFSSGATVAVKSASLAATCITKHLNNIEVDWDTEFNEELQYGVSVFKNFIDSWYNEDLQKIIFSDTDNIKIKSHLTSILAGYAWDKENPYTSRTQKRLSTLSQVL